MARRDNDPCFFQLLFVLEKHCIYAACLRKKSKFKRSNQSKVPSINKHCFLFPLSSFFATVELYLLGCLFSIAKLKGLRSWTAFAWGESGVRLEWVECRKTYLFRLLKASGGSYCGCPGAAVARGALNPSPPVARGALNPSPPTTLGWIGPRQPRSRGTPQGLPKIKTIIMR